jgi:hypothetical protein
LNMRVCVNEVEQVSERGCLKSHPMTEGESFFCAFGSDPLDKQEVGELEWINGIISSYLFL